MKHVTRLAFLLVAGLLFITSWALYIPSPAKAGFVIAPHGAAAKNEVPLFSEHWVSGHETAEAHSANITMHQGLPTAIWYGGTEEGASDVRLFLSQFRDNNWSAPEVVMDRATSQTGLNRFIRKIGNPTLHSWPDGTLGVYYVSVSMGGWGASSINYTETSDSGRSWSTSRRLVTSPFLNISTLVRAIPAPLADGSIMLPVYHELVGKFGEVLRLTQTGDVLAKTRISHGKHSLQPAVAPLDEHHAILALRHAVDQGGRVLQATTADGGMTWTRPEPLTLPNPNAAIALLTLADDTLLMALNDTEDGRHRLSLALLTGPAPSDEPRPSSSHSPWRIVKTIESEAPASGSHEFEFSYPSLVHDEAGRIHLVYTWNQTRIKHIVFNRAWLSDNEVIAR
jgi:predicted neuraminidase